MLPGRGDAFYLHNRRGPMVRALRFEERSLLLTTNTANGDVAALIADAALVSPGECVDEVRVGVSLALAGGGEEAPSFSECARLIEQNAGWNVEQVSATMALVIDRLCGAMAQQESQHGWERIVFEEDEADVETLTVQMAANLSKRAVPLAPVATPDRATTAQTKDAQDWPVSHRSKTQTNKFSFPTTSQRSASSVSSALPNVRDVKRIPARVLAPTSPSTNQTNSIMAFSRSAQVESTAETTTVARTNQSNLSVTQTTPVVFEQPLLTSPPSTSWQSFKPSTPNAHASQTSAKNITSQQPMPTTPAQTATQFSATTDSPSFNDWLSELAQLLEAECDLRGIDP